MYSSCNRVIDGIVPIVPNCFKSKRNLASLCTMVSVVLGPLFLIGVLVLLRRYGGVDNSGQSQRAERFAQQQRDGHHVLQQPPLPGRGEGVGLYGETKAPRRPPP